MNFFILNKNTKIIYPKDELFYCHNSHKIALKAFTNEEYTWVYIDLQLFDLRISRRYSTYSMDKIITFKTIKSIIQTGDLNATV